MTFKESWPQAQAFVRREEGHVWEVMPGADKASACLQEAAAWQWTVEVKS